ncbi:TPA: hypothetical protein I3789_004636 [Enterobacter cloacae]|uniref:hypothetical protein n=1 Tax=Enterobacter sichuanensis TaxID=2071710 RepID=UPI00296C201C|nr:hypothetical protein [Enterobacter sichuanensis]MEB5959760.1 hypothetical protein [Enterobacter sichuanensis]HAS1065202.1 hypothetical protein [Enterobacter cloacae]HAS1098057.1 hypothetical protein [Enterobacter cloacae]
MGEIIKIRNKNMRDRCATLWLFFSSAGAAYHWIGFGSLAVLLVKVLVLNGIPAPLRVMSAVSPVVEGVLGSVIASYIFYLLCIHPQVYKEKKTSAAFVNLILTRIKNSFEGHLKDISPTLNYDSTAQDFDVVFTALDPFTDAPLLLQPIPPIRADWFGFFLDNKMRINTNISRLMDSRLVLDIETINTLNKITSCAWFTHIEHMGDHKHLLSRSHNHFVNADKPEASCCRSLYDLKELIRSLQPAIDATEKLKD